MSPAPDNKSTPLKPIKWYRSLATKKGRLEAQAFLVEGDRPIRQIISNNPADVLEILTTGELPPFYHKYSSRLVSERQLRAICSAKTPQGIVAIVRLPLDTYADQLPPDIGTPVLLLEDVQDPGNVGTLIRTAVAFGFAGIILTEKCADPFSPKCVQSTAGTVLSLWIRKTARYLELAEQLKHRGYFLVATDLDGTAEPSVLLNLDKLLLALGNEASGLSEELLDISHCRLRIPTIRDKAESLNVAACGAICMYLSYRQ